MSLEVMVADDMPCPKCGAYWGHPDAKLNRPNRPKVAAEDGVWWWRCYNEECEVAMYEPESGSWG